MPHSHLTAPTYQKLSPLRTLLGGVALQDVGPEGGILLSEYVPKGIMGSHLILLSACALFALPQVTATTNGYTPVHARGAKEGLACSQAGNFKTMNQAWIYCLKHFILVVKS